jgi:hypothetical protein
MRRRGHRQGETPAFGALGFALLLAASLSWGAACSGGTTASNGKAAHAAHDAGKDASAATAASTARSDSLVPLPALAQLGAVVQDATAASNALTQTLGIGPWTMVEQKGKNAKGKPFAARLAYAYVGDLELELVEVTSGETPQTEFLRDHGEGLYDLGFFVDDVDGDVARLKGRGATVLLQEPGAWAYVDSPDAGGVLFKLVKTREKLSIDETGFERPPDSLRPTKVDHVGAWADDVTAMTEQWARAFRVGNWNIFPFTLTPNIGDPVEATLAFTSALGPTQVELV